MPLPTLFNNVATMLERFDADVKLCAEILTEGASRLGYTEAQLWRLWKKYTSTTDRRFI